MREVDKQMQAVLASYKDRLKQDSTDGSPDVMNVLHCIHEHIFDPLLTVQWLSENCHIRNNNFSGKFRHFTGFGLKKYILYHRLEAAKELLLETSTSSVNISEIGYQVGFANYATFNRAFHKHIGKPPAQWLRERN